MKKDDIVVLSENLFDYCSYDRLKNDIKLGSILKMTKLKEINSCNECLFYNIWISSNSTNFIPACPKYCFTYRGLVYKDITDLL